MHKNAYDISFTRITFQGKPALLTRKRIDKATLPKGAHCYDIRHGDNSARPCTVENKVAINFYGSIVTREPIPLSDQGYLNIKRSMLMRTSPKAMRLSDFLADGYLAGHEPTQQERESAFLSAPDNAFAIYQLKPGDETRDLRFEPLERIAGMNMTIDRGNYELVYTAPLPERAGYDAAHHLHDLYQTFNINCPEDYTGHSLSVSDVIALKRDGAVACYFVDRWDFKELPAFLPPRNLLKNAADIPFDRITFQDKPALLTRERIDKTTLPNGMHCYDIRHGDNSARPCTVESKVAVNFYGSIVTKEPIPLPSDGYLNIKRGMLIRTGPKAVRLSDFLAEPRPRESVIERLEAIHSGQPKKQKKAPAKGAGQER